jgi:hypothetical protein
VRRRRGSDRWSCGRGDGDGNRASRSRRRGARRGRPPPRNQGGARRPGRRCTGRSADGGSHGNARGTMRLGRDRRSDRRGRGTRRELRGPGDPALRRRRSSRESTDQTDHRGDAHQHRGHPAAPRGMTARAGAPGRERLQSFSCRRVSHCRPPRRATTAHRGYRHNDDRIFSAATGNFRRAAFGRRAPAAFRAGRSYPVAVIGPDVSDKP